MKHVAVLMGGWSAEREVSLRSGKACADALERAGGYRVSRVDVTRDIAATLAALKPDSALNVLNGRPGGDGTLQGLLEIADIPYSAFGHPVYDAQSALLTHGAFYTNYVSLGQRRGNTNYNLSFENTKQDDDTAI